MKFATRFFFPVFSMAICLLLAGCGETKIDLSSDKAYSESIKKIYEAVPEADREEFRKNFSAILSEVKGMGSGVLNERDMLAVYDIVKAFGGDEGVKMLQPINGLSAKEIAKRGKDIRRMRVEKNLNELKDNLQELEKKVEVDKRIEDERQKVEIAFTGVEAIESFDYKNKPLGVVGFLGAAITVKNNSSMPVRRLDGNVIFSDDVGSQLAKFKIRGELKPADTPMRDYFNSDLDIAPGAEWKGKIYMRFDNPKKSNQLFPVPAGKQYQANFSDLEVLFADASPRDIERRANWLQSLQNSIKETEAELAKLK